MVPTAGERPQDARQAREAHGRPVTRRTSWRRADWRFLLPAPREGGPFSHLVLLGGPTDLHERVLELGIAGMVSRRPVAGADALIILDGHQSQVMDAARGLADGGALYWELDTRSGTSLGRARRLLREAGLTVCGVYWARPDFARCRMYVPLDVAGPLSWCAATFWRRRDVVARFARFAAGIPGALRIAAATVRHVAIIAVRGRPARPSLIAHPAIANRVSRPTTPVLLAGGEGEWSRVVLVPFETGCASPSAVLKLPRSSLFNSDTEREHDLTGEIARSLDDRMRASLPSRGEPVQWAGLSGIVEDCVRGRSLHTRLGTAHPADQALDDLRAAAGWLTEFHRQTLAGRVPWFRRRRDWPFDRAWSDYGATFGLLPEEGELFEAVGEVIERASGAALPIVWQHGDFGPWNVYRTPNGIRVIDWEVARRGPALCDLLYFILHWTAGLGGANDEASRLETCRRLFIVCDESRVAAAARGEIARYRDALQLAPPLVPVLLVFCFVEQALDRARRLAALDDPRAPSRAGNPYVAGVELLASNTQRLLAEVLP